jgi:phosphopantothenoylcysteine decarboxylase / phosphopantothenate---cysteine ligase
MKPLNLQNKKIIITAGPTREWLDPVRFISNPSTGKMGVALAKEAYKISHNVTLIHGPISKTLIKELPFKTVQVETTLEMLEEVLSTVSDGCVLIMAAAPGDYRPREISEFKIKKHDDVTTLEMVRNPDILIEVAKLKDERSYKSMITVGFAAETHDMINYGKLKLSEKDLDMICINDVSNPDVGFGSDNNSITIITKTNYEMHIVNESKDKVAHKIMGVVDSLAKPKQY